jgi:Protein of unknown function (DUF3592)
MYSVTRMLIGVSVYVVYLVAITAALNYSVVLYLVLLIAGIALLFLSIATGWLTKPGNYNRLMTKGVEAPATILEMHDTGVTVYKSPYVKMRLRVQPAGHPAYETGVKVLVSRLSIPGVGDTLQVRYDPAKPTDVIVLT